MLAHQYWRLYNLSCDGNHGDGDQVLVSNLYVSFFFPFFFFTSVSGCWSSTDMAKL